MTADAQLDAPQPAAIRDLAVVASSTIVCAGVLTGGRHLGLAGPAWAAVTVVAGLPLALVLPGYAYSVLLLPRRTRPDNVSPLLWRSIWSVGLSLVVAVLAGLLLNEFPLGLTVGSQTVALGWISLAGVALAGLVRLAESERPRTRRPVDAGPVGPADADGTVPPTAEVAGAARRPPRSWATRAAVTGYTLVVMVLIACSVGLAVVSAHRRAPAQFAQLWLAPVRVTPNPALEAPDPAQYANLGVRNDHATRTGFRLVLNRDGAKIGGWHLTLAPGQTWRTTIAMPTSGHRLQATLTGTGQSATTQAVSLQPPSD